MVHPRLTAVGSVTPVWLAEVGPTGAWGDLSWTTRYGEGACGMYEASWTMPLPSHYEHPLLRRGTLVELMDGTYRVGSPLILSEPARGTGYDDPWRLVATGIGREIEGEGTFYAFDGSGDITTEADTALDAAIARGLRIDGYEVGFPTAPFGAISTDSPFSIGALLTAIGNATAGQRWGVGDDNLLHYYTDPTTPTWHVIPGAAALGVADDDYATVGYVRYNDSVTVALETVFSPATASPTEQRFGRREFLVDLTDRPAMTAAVAQGFADGILAKSKGRLGWTNGLTLTSNELLSAGGVPADLSMVEAGQMVRLHGISSDLLETNGQTWLDIVIGETRYTDGAQTIDVNPLGLAARNLAAVVEAVSGKTAA